MSWTWFHRLGSPPSFYATTEWLAPILGWLAAALLAYGWLGGLFLAPADYQQGDAFRIIYVHVPAAALSLSFYTLMAVAGAVALIWRIKLAECVLVSAAPIGASLTAVALITGMLWGKPMWGAYWVWDARLTSELVMLFLYLGVIGLHQAIEDPRAAARACALLALVGVVNVPIVHFAVTWWNTLHQGETIRLIGPSKMDSSMLWPLLVIAAATKFWYIGSVLVRARTLGLAQEGGKQWAIARYGDKP